MDGGLEAMVIDAVVNAVLGLLDLIVDPLPSFTMPSWAQADGPIRDLWQTLLARMGHFGAWVPTGAISTVAPVLLTLFGLCKSYQLAMYVWSLVKKIPFL
jgi:hypothetical protein